MTTQNNAIIRHLGTSREDFLLRYNPSVASILLQKGYSPGKVALLTDVPCLCDVADRWGVSIAQKWIEIQLTSIEEKQGCGSVFIPEAKAEAAALLYSCYRDMNIAEFLLFFAWFKLGKYQDIYSGGLEKVMYAFAKYRENRDGELLRIEREEEFRRAEREWEARAGKCISYEEYIKERDEDYSKDIVR